MKDRLSRAVRTSNKKKTRRTTDRKDEDISKEERTKWINMEVNKIIFNKFSKIHSFNELDLNEKYIYKIKNNLFISNIRKVDDNIYIGKYANILANSIKLLKVYG